MATSLLEAHTLKTGSAFELESSEHFEDLELVYYTSRRSYTPGEKVVWICHALTGDADPSDWWPQLVGEGLLIDPCKYFVVCVNMLSSPYGSTCPMSPKPSDSLPYLLDFPKITIRDMVRSCILVRKALGVEKIDLLLGPSIGGYMALEWAIMEASVIGNAVFLASAPRVTPYMTALNESQRMALEADQTFRQAAARAQEGFPKAGGQKGLACARTIALESYRSFDGYNLTQVENDPDCLFADRAASYHRYQGKKLVDRFDAYSYYYLTYALDSHNVGRGRGGVRKALCGITARSLVINITSDVLFPPKIGRSVASSIKDCTYAELSSLFGHDGFLVESKALNAILAPFFESSLG